MRLRPPDHEYNMDLRHVTAREPDEDELAEMAAMERLRADCPFCHAPADGGALTIETTRTMCDGLFVRCGNCGAGGPNFAKTHDHAVTLWEGRAA